MNFRTRQIIEIRFAKKLLPYLRRGKSKKYWSNTTKFMLQRTKYSTLSTTPLFFVHSACTITSAFTAAGISACGTYIDIIIKIRFFSLIFLYKWPLETTNMSPDAID